MARDASLIIRGGTLVDGTGAPAYEADIAIGDGRILEIGKISTRAPEERISGASRASCAAR